jgi:hypothetical protein
MNKNLFTKHSDSLGDSSLDLLVKLVDADVINKFLNRFVIVSAAEYSAYFDFDENIIEGRA